VMWEADEERTFFRATELVCNDYLSQIYSNETRCFRKIIVNE
jgi:hypothetical protein